MPSCPENDDDNDEEAHRRFSPCFFTTHIVPDADVKEQILSLSCLPDTHDIFQRIFQPIPGPLIQNGLII
jgi:hypothetical protein